MLIIFAQLYCESSQYIFQYNLISILFRKVDFNVAIFSQQQQQPHLFNIEARKYIKPTAFTQQTQRIAVLLLLYESMAKVVVHAPH